MYGMVMMVNLVMEQHAGVLADEGGGNSGGA